jgi:hypothetical protein
MQGQLEPTESPASGSTCLIASFPHMAHFIVQSINIELEPKRKKQPINLYSETEINRPCTWPDPELEISFNFILALVLEGELVVHYAK